MHTYAANVMSTDSSDQNQESVAVLGNQWKEPQHDCILPRLTYFSKDATIAFACPSGHDDIHKETK